MGTYTFVRQTSDFSTRIIVHSETDGLFRWTGDAVMFRTGVFEPGTAESSGDDGLELGSPDWRLWHSGCHVREVC
jgi:hypothetical protein